MQSYNDKVHNKSIKAASLEDALGAAQAIADAFEATADASLSDLQGRLQALVPTLLLHLSTPCSELSHAQYYPNATSGLDEPTGPELQRLVFASLTTDLRREFWAATEGERGIPHASSAGVGELPLESDFSGWRGEKLFYVAGAALQAVANAVRNNRLLPKGPDAQVQKQKQKLTYYYNGNRTSKEHAEGRGLPVDHVAAKDQGSLKYVSQYFYELFMALESAWTDKLTLRSVLAVNAVVEGGQQALIRDELRSDERVWALFASTVTFAVGDDETKELARQEQGLYWVLFEFILDWYENMKVKDFCKTVFNKLSLKAGESLRTTQSVQAAQKQAEAKRTKTG